VKIDKTCLITGATSGIGLATARALVRKGFSVIVVGCSVQKVDAVVSDLRLLNEAVEVDGLVADLFLQSEVRRLAEMVVEGKFTVDVLVNNVGGFFMDRQLTVDRVERTWALNYLNVVLLTDLLLPVLRREGCARIVNVASLLHVRGQLDFDNLNGEQVYDGLKAYCFSKLAMVLWSYRLARLLL